jgi:membrane protease subunit HflK
MLIKFLIALPILLIVLWGSLTSFYTIQPEERGVVLRFGKFTGLTDPGLHFKLPFGIDEVVPVATERVLKQEFGFRTTQAGERSQFAEDFPEESLMLTGDLNIIDVSWVVQYRIEDPEKYLFEIREAERTLRDVSEAVMRRIVGNRLGSDVLTTGRMDIANVAREEIQKIMETYNSGLHINTVELQDVVPPQRVQPAFNEVNVSRQERERMINEAEKRRNQQIPRKEGEANQMIAEAEGYAIERVNRAKGETVRFESILEEYESAPEVTRKRLYLEMIDKVLPNAAQVLIVQDQQMGPLPLLDMNSGRNVKEAGQ